MTSFTIIMKRGSVPPALTLHSSIILVLLQERDHGFGIFLTEEVLTQWDNWYNAVERYIQPVSEPAKLQYEKYCVKILDELAIKPSGEPKVYLFNQTH